MLIDDLLDAPFYSGAAVSVDVPSRFPIGIDGRPYMVDLESDQTGLRGQYFRHSTLPLLRVQANTGDVPDESSVNPDDLWRRTQDDWSHGAGQSWLDRSTSDPARFRSSKGIDPWTRYQLSLLPDTSQVVTSANTNLQAVSCGLNVYLLDGQALKFYNTTSGATTTVTGTPANIPVAIATNGSTVYAAYTTAVYSTANGAAAATSYSTLASVGVLGYVNGRLMAASTNVLYNIVTSGAGPAALFTHPDAGFVWSCFAEGPTAIYAGGNSGQRALIYRIGITSGSTSLDAPIVAGKLPTGETVNAMREYLGFLLLATSQGVRLASINGDGSLVIGGLIREGTTANPTACQCLSAFDRFVYFGWTNYDAVSTGLGRADLSVFTADNTPAYASDIMATGQGAVLSVVQVANVVAFTVSGKGLYVGKGTPAVTLTYVPVGTLDTGLLTYGLVDPKVALFIDVKTKPLPAGSGQTTSLAVDSGTFTLIGSNTGAGSVGPPAQYAVNATRGESFEIREELDAGTSNLTSPTFTRHVLRSYPAPNRSFEWVIPILVHAAVNPYGLGDEFMDYNGEVAILMGLAVSRRVVKLQVGSQSYSVVVEDCDMLPYKIAKDGLGYESTTIVRLKQFSG